MVTIVDISYHMGRHNVEVGAGPGRVLETGIAQQIGANLHSLELGDSVSWQAVNEHICEAVRRTREIHSWPLIMAGNCNSCLGTLAGLNDAQPGIVWFDAHGDFHTPETSISKLIEGMALAMASERFVPASKILLIGGRDLDRGEDERVASRLTHIKTPLSGEITLPDLGEIYVHLDVDVLDPAISPGVNARVPGGFTLEQLERSLEIVFRRYEVIALAITNYNPERDVDETTRDNISRLIRHIARLHIDSSSR